MIEMEYKKLTDKNVVARIDAQRAAAELLALPDDIDAETIGAEHRDRLQDLLRDQNKAFMDAFPVGHTIVLSNRKIAGSETGVIKCYEIDRDTKIPTVVVLKFREKRSNGERSISNTLQNCDVTLLADVPVDENLVRRDQFQSRIFGDIIPLKLMPHLRSLKTRSFDLAHAEKMLKLKFRQWIQKKWNNTTAPLFVRSDESLIEAGMQFFEAEYGFRE